MNRIMFIVWENSGCSEKVQQVIAMDNTIVSAWDSAHIQVAERVRTSVVEIVQVNGVNLCVKISHMHFDGVVQRMVETAISDKL